GVPAMTVGGTGDVLTGIVAALLSTDLPAFRAACAAAFVSGMSGEMAFDVRGDHIVATDCIEN
ncbi:MAG: bifunctional ADP-dependent NAD(P)H-hydrate dehydratase/NAD(P)H-hydrate epimerase, partial [Desulfobacterales bacterium]|nr:bifunctional ADP-dependent NAD(P)H-hydrate dehydratase/NAD(P)H-hydrate epimerase [Desulfobacterales bacterium]NIV67807.1 bifunctional ADP-dependent NAD(P)H-hydrate dehydratase/NAD(P)H-hydrate epimerase [Candidatus Bathyarchaeota archaeon]